MENNAVRIIDELGRIVLPREVWQALNWGDQTCVEFFLNENEHKIVIKRHMSACYYCGNTENVKQFKNQLICAHCQGVIASL